MADEWTTVSLKVECEAYLPEPGDKIGTLNGVEIANANTVVIRQRHSDSADWHVFITDRDAFDARYDHDLFGNDEDDDDGGEEDAEDQVSEYWNYTVPELREELEKRDLDTSGNKPELVARLEEND